MAATSIDRTSLAAVSWEDVTGKEIHVFGQAPNGDIRQMFYFKSDGKYDWYRRPNDMTIVGTGKIGTPIAAVYYQPFGYISVFYLDEEDKIVERSNTQLGYNPWREGGASGKFQAAPYSGLAAVTTTGTFEDTHIFYQDTTNKLIEIINGAVGTSDLPVALPGTSIAAAVDSSLRRNEISIYYQDVNLTLKELLFTWPDNVWVPGPFKATGVFAPGASLSAAKWSENTKGCVASIDENNQLCITPDEEGAVDASPTFDVGQTTSAQSKVALTQRTYANDDLDLFFQTQEGTIAQVSSADGITWSLGSTNIQDGPYIQ